MGAVRVRVRVRVRIHTGNKKRPEFSVFCWHDASGASGSRKFARTINCKTPDLFYFNEMRFAHFYFLFRVEVTDQR